MRGRLKRGLHWHSVAAIRRPGITLLVAAALTVAALPGLLELELRTDGRALAPRAAPAVILDAEIRRDFGVRDPLAIVLSTDSAAGIFESSFLHRLAELSDALGEIPGLRPYDVTSLATEPGFRYAPGTLRFRRLLEPRPETDADLAELRGDLEHLDLYEGTLVSRDAQSAAIFVGMPERDDRAEMISEIERLAEEIVSPRPGESVAVLGPPVAEARLGRHILADLGLDGFGMGHLALLVMAGVFLAAFRRPAAVLLPLLEVGSCLGIVFGVMGWLGHPVYLTTAVLPVILVAVGTADEIHLFRRYLELAATHEDKEHRLIVEAALTEIAPPIVQTSLTTAVAFLSFALSPLPPVRIFGLYAAFGVLLCMVFSLTVIPAAIMLLGARAFIPGSSPRARERRNAFASLASPLYRHRHAVLLLGAAAALLAVDGVRRLQIQDSWIDGFDPQSAFVRATRHFDAQFLGSHVLRLVLEAAAPVLEGEISEARLGAHELTLDAPSAAPEPPAPERLEGSSIHLFELRDASATPRTGPPRQQQTRQQQTRQWQTRQWQTRQWQTRIESASRREDGALVLTMPRRRGSARFWLRPEKGQLLGYEIRAEPFTVPALLARVAALEAFVAAQPGVGGVIGPARYLATTNYMTRSASLGKPADDKARRLPATPEEARRLWTNYGRVRGEERLRQLLDEGFERALVTVYLEDSNYRDTRRLMTRLRAFEQEHLQPHGMSLAFAGDVAVSQALIGGVVQTQVRSVLFSLVAVLGMGWWLMGSWRRGLYCLVPPAFAVGLVFAVMGWTGTPLGVATSTFAGMTLGVGVDFAIHLLARHRRAQHQGLRGEAAVSAALASAGPAILIDAGAVALGLGVLAASRVPANARLGALLAVSVAACLVAAIFFVPALLGRRAADPKTANPATDQPHG